MKKGNLGGFPLTNLNTKISPKHDFFRYACGGWIKRNPIPETKSAWGSFYKLRENGSKRLQKIVKDIASKRSLTRKSESALIRDFYLSGTDMKTRNSLQLSPIAKTFREIEEISSANGLFEFITESHKIGLSLLFATGVGQDYKKSDTNITFIGQNGLTLPDRDFYLKKDKRSREIRKAYLLHIENMMRLSGVKAKEARKTARILLTLETKIAKISMDKVEARDVKKTYNKMTVANLQKKASQLNWRDYLTKIGLKNAKQIVVLQPNYLSKVLKLIETESTYHWKIYLYWQVLHEASSYLSSNFVKENFSFFGKILLGNKKMEPEWKRVIGLMNALLGDALGKVYVKKYFDNKAKGEVDALVSNLFLAYKKRIRNLDWMSKATKKKALLKLAQMTPKIGYPKKWESYKGLLIRKNAYFENIVRSSIYHQKKEFRKLTKKVDRNKWQMNAQTVNAYYSANLNDIVFPAAILQPPFFNPNADAAINYGSIGSVIGHEMTHGFDDQGAKFDEKGNLKNWWTKTDLKKFNRKAKVLVKQFNAYKIAGRTVNGKFTLGENIADLGGIVIAYDAYQHYLEKNKRKNIKGFTPEQRFFLGFSLFECQHAREEYEQMAIIVDPHSPAKFRINGPLSNLEEFYDAFSVADKSKLYRNRTSRAKIW